jgi:hypothetical protein
MVKICKKHGKLWENHGNGGRKHGNMMGKLIMDKLE